MHVTLNCIDKKALNKVSQSLTAFFKALKLIRKKNSLPLTLCTPCVIWQLATVTSGVSGVRLSYRQTQEVGESATSSRAIFIYTCRLYCLRLGKSHSILFEQGYAISVMFLLNVQNCASAHIKVYSLICQLGQPLSPDQIISTTIEWF